MNCCLLQALPNLQILWRIVSFFQVIIDLKITVKEHENLLFKMFTDKPSTIYGISELGTRSVSWLGTAKSGDVDTKVVKTIKKTFTVIIMRDNRNHNGERKSTSRCYFRHDEWWTKDATSTSAKS
jgi:hypothetical protein